MIVRTFRDIPEGKINDADQQPLSIDLGWGKGSTWDSLLLSKRILIISEAGTGKTYECRAQAKRLWANGELAFFLELATLANEDVRGQLDSDEETRLDNWLTSQSEVATFFLDSVDELKLTKGSVELALKRLKKCIKNQLHRVRIIITTRPIPYDKKLVEEILPVPKTPLAKSNEDTFALIAMGEYSKSKEHGSSLENPEWRFVTLNPLSDELILQLSRIQGVSEPELLLNELQRRNAQEFARRPQDLIELCADWCVHKRIRTHHDQVATNVGMKLRPRKDGNEPAQLSVDMALEGASRLALAVQTTRRLTIRYNSELDVGEEEVTLDPALVLSDWQQNEIKALLERPIFGFASYGRVRFHHRSVAEYLAAERLVVLRSRGMPFQAMKRLLFVETKGKIIVRPSKRSIAGWLALKESRIFELLRDNEPAVLMNEGDPESLSQTQRNQVLRAFADCYGLGGWRGLQVPLIQVHRFATKELADEINSIWHKGIENPDVREVILNLVEVGCIKACADLAFNVINDSKSTVSERLTALDASVALEDHRLRGTSAGISCADDLWNDRFARGAIVRLFPNYMSVNQLCMALKWLKSETRNVGDLGWHLRRLISSATLDQSSLEKLRDNLVDLISEGLRWQENGSHMVSDRPHLSGILAATCQLGLEISKDDKWLLASTLAVRLDPRDHYDNEPIKSLNERLSFIDANNNERLFWIVDSLCQKLNSTDDPWKRYAEATDHCGPMQLRHNRDLHWVKQALGDLTRSADERAMLLEAAIRLTPDYIVRKEHIEGLEPLIADTPTLRHKLYEWLKPSKYEEENLRWKKKQTERNEQEQRRKAKNRASWVQFWREVANHPDRAFSSEQAWNTAWNLWRAMSQNGSDSRASGWNRRFLEEQFNSEIADRLRLVLMKIWRNDHPIFPSERPESERNRFLIRWQLGLAAIYAEAEDHDWATKLTSAEAQLAARYVQVELNGFPLWIDDVAKSHPDALVLTLGKELIWEFEQPIGPNSYSSLLQSISGSSDRVAQLFLPQLTKWLDIEAKLDYDSDNAIGVLSRIRQVLQLIVRHGTPQQIDKIESISRQKLAQNLPYVFQLVWLSILLKINPQIGIEILTIKIENIEPAANSEAVRWFASLFGDRQDSLHLGEEHFSPKQLVHLIRLAYKHVRIEDDSFHEGSYSPDTRDDAEWARNRMVTALFNTKGEDGWSAKLEMAADPLCAHFKDRILAVASEHWAQEIDADAFNESQAVALDKTGEAPATTNEAMFAILKDRLSDLDELLLLDSSPREAWAGIHDERVMRREIARELKNASKSLYTVDQEAVTADEKETDIRLRSTFSQHEAVIELKLADNRSATDLLETIENQLVKKYMAAEHCKSGALLITLGKTKKWQHPIDNRQIGCGELMQLLQKEAERVQINLVGRIYIAVHLLDLRTRLPVESKAKS